MMKCIVFFIIFSLSFSQSYADIQVKYKTYEDVKFEEIFKLLSQKASNFKDPECLLKILKGDSKHLAMSGLGFGIYTIKVMKNSVKYKNNILIGYRGPHVDDEKLCTFTVNLRNR